MGKNIPILIPQGDQENLRRQVTQRLNKIGSDIAKSSFRTEPMDLGHNRITSVADPGNPTDAVNLRTLKKHLDDIALQHVQRRQTTGTVFSIVFNNFGAATVGQLSAPYIGMPNRVGSTVLVKVAATGTGTGSTTVNLKKLNVSGTATMLASDAVLPASQTGPITVSNFTLGGSTLAVDDLIYPVVTTAGGASFLTVELEIQP